jgi:CPA1 family monovalent cation:H+ antiporter
MLIMALPLYFFMSFSPLEALLLGVILSATDPLAVGALIEGNKKVSESQKLLIEGESILNDGFVVTVSGIFAVMIFEGGEFSVLSSGKEFLQHVLGAIALGIIIARGGRWLINKWHSDSFSLRVNMTLSIAYGSFALGELIQVSGILAVFAAALAYGYKPKLDDHNKHIHNHLWEYFNYLSNAVLFFLLGASFFVYFSADSLTMTLLCVLAFLLIAPRLISLMILSPFIKIDGAKLNKKEILLLNFAGAKGAVSIALILLLPDSFALKETCLSIAFLMIFLSLLIYPICLGQIIKSETS